ncbi:MULTISPECIES: extracellular solute-binding protein [Streptomyces]|uniref:Multiple sugar transport system substrate-binding protein n=1 Tax=Streptomyces harbinensis TaxID=1176198 RepID=A0A1I6S3E3_9ACTN|nr:MULTISPECIES: extracellular solute-binding protein [Streptomyces]MCK1813601.1 extracellular solute-binding protein [Streptomyces sp. XM4011]QKV71968.1 extracellular solute-binding protein [Streptomyces harbinensis]SFS71457.1 multiple sugar transport system substrate-binding protein [Streptomyces harbinensis]
MNHRTVAVLAATVFSSVALAGCGGSSDDSSSGPVNLTYWAWAPGMDEVVALWNDANPDIQVTVKKQASGDDLVTKTITAAKAGNAPDLMQAEYQALPTLVSNDVLADISDQVAGAEDAFAPGLWQQVTLGTDAVYALPQDSGPLMFYYRADLFEEYGLTVPTTWDEFADTARALKETEPGKVLTTFSANDAGLFAGLAQQAGAQWWTTEGEQWKVAIDDEATGRVADFWGGLVAEGVIDNQPMYTPAWNNALNTGEQLAWVSAVWAPGTLTTAAPDTAGKWAMAPLPQWNAGENVTGSWGGSTTAVTNDARDKDAAAAFATWLNTDPEALTALVRAGGIYPAATAAQSGEALAEAPEFFANQPDFYVTAAEIAEGTAPAAWGPNTNVAYATFNDAFGEAARTRGDFRAALTTMQRATADDMTGHGFQVIE